MRAALLRGRDHTAMGEVAAAAEGAVAVALSRGGAPKPYPHTDLNEDAALCARGARGLLVAVADGHWGHRASELALEHLRAAIAGDWTDGEERSAARWRAEALEALAGANQAVLAARSPDQRSCTTLALALARPEDNRLVCVAIGDSHVFLVADGEPVERAAARGRRVCFLGERPLSSAALQNEVRIEVQALAPCLALVVATDGLSEQAIGVDDPVAAVRTAISVGRPHAVADRATATARALADVALAAHRKNQAGDNVALGVAWVERAG